MKEGMRSFLIPLLALAITAPALFLPGKGIFHSPFRNPASDEGMPQMGRAERIYRDGCRLFHMGVDPQKLAQMQARDRTRLLEDQEFRAQLERDRQQEQRDDAERRSQAARDNAEFRRQQRQSEVESRAITDAGVRDHTLAVRSRQLSLNHASAEVSRLAASQLSHRSEIRSLDADVRAHEARITILSRASRGLFDSLPTAKKREVLVRAGLGVAADNVNQAFSRAFDTWANTMLNIPLDMFGPNGRMARGFIQPTHTAQESPSVHQAAEWIAEQGMREASPYVGLKEAEFQKIATARKSSSMAAALNSTLARIDARDQLVSRNLSGYERQATHMLANQDRIRAFGYASMRGRELAAKSRSELAGIPARLESAHSDLASSRGDLQDAQSQLSRERSVAASLPTDSASNDRAGASSADH